jgi:hypothetical protein
MISLSKNKLGHDANILLSNNSLVSLSSYRKQQGNPAMQKFLYKKRNEYHVQRENMVFDPEHGKKEKNYLYRLIRLRN